MSEDRDIRTVLHEGGKGTLPAAGEADPITTEIIRHGLNAAAEQMKRVMIRTAFSPLIYEALDFAVALYDRHVRLLAQAPTLLVFMGTLNFCVEAAVEAIGGEDELAEGDILIYNIPYRSGAHAQDVAMIMPVFDSSKDLVGYAVAKAHWLDMAGKDVYATNTVDVFQEGTLFPGVRLWREGVLVDDVYRIAMANSRLRRAVEGDMNAEAAAVRAGEASLKQIVERWGRTTFEAAVERMFDHGEAIVRQSIDAIPDGRYAGRGAMDDDGLSSETVEFDIEIDVRGSDITLDYTQAPQSPGPVNCPVGCTVSASRVAITLLAGSGESPNEGFFRPIRVRTAPGTLFHPEPPAPCFLYFWTAMQAVEVIYHAIGHQVPAAVSASSGACNCGIAWWGNREATGQPWGDGSPHPVGQGGYAGGDGASSLIHCAQGASRFSPVEVWEAKNPWLIESFELAADSGGAGEFRGGLGVDIVFRMLEDCWLTPTIERTKTPPWGLAGGDVGRPNELRVVLPDGTETTYGKATGVFAPAGSCVVLKTGGGGGFGNPARRSLGAIERDLREGYVTDAYVERHHPRALAQIHERLAEPNSTRKGSPP